MDRLDIFRRFHVEPAPVNDENPRRSQLQADIDRFLAGGGKITRIASDVGTQPVFTFNMGERALVNGGKR